MDQNYNDTQLLTNSDYESIIEDLKPGNFGSFGSPFHIEQYGAVPVTQLQDGTQNMLVTSPPKQSPSLSPTGTIPSRDTYPGHLEFEIQLDSATASKRSWLYSTILSKVFIDMNKSLLVQFHVNDFRNGLFVRALPVYQQDDFVSVPVQRCGLHSLSDDPHGRAHPASEPGVCYCPSNCMVRHVVLCTHPQSTYDYNSESDRHSVVAPLQPPQSGCDTTTLEYLFTCKTSCPRGMNRKPIVVIFTLENEQYEVLGRLILPVKICSCPKRDKEKEEREQEERDKQGQVSRGKRRISSHEKQELKRIKTENSEINGGTQEPQENGMQRPNTFEAEKINQKENILKKICEIEYKADTIHQKVTDVENKIHQKVTDVENKIHQKVTDVENKIHQKVTDVENKICHMVDTIHQKVTDLENKIGQIFNVICSRERPSYM